MVPVVGAWFSNFFSRGENGVAARARAKRSAARYRSASPPSPCGRAPSPPPPPSRTTPPPSYTSPTAKRTQKQTLTTRWHVPRAREDPALSFHFPFPFFENQESTRARRGTRDVGVLDREDHEAARVRHEQRLVHGTTRRALRDLRGLVLAHHGRLDERASALHVLRHARDRHSIQVQSRERHFFLGACRFSAGFFSKR